MTGNENLIQILLIGLIVLAVVTIILLILFLVQLSKIRYLERRLNRFMTGRNAHNLEKEIVGLVEDTKMIKASIEVNKNEMKSISKKMQLTYQKMGLIKYDAFKQMGGQRSFCLSLLNENNSGFIINSVHSTEGCYTYTKDIRNCTSVIDLGEEEQEVLAIAMNQ